MNKEKIKVVILCGGLGTRLREETEFRPKPMVEIGSHPILWHIMKIYAHYGLTDFVLCLGYKGDMIKEHFLNYEAMNNDFTIQLGAQNKIEFNSNHAEGNWRITLADTGESTMTGSRVKKIAQYIDSDVFMLTYGDGVADIDVKKLLDFHCSHGKLATVTGVRPSSRFGELIIENGKLKQFSEKPQIHEGFINGGFFVFNRKVFDYLDDEENCILEKDPLERLTREGQLEVYQHDGYWHCMDTQRDMLILTEEWAKGNPAWKVWEK